MPFQCPPSQGEEEGEVFRGLLAILVMVTKPAWIKWKFLNIKLVSYKKYFDTFSKILRCTNYDL